ncbi:MAG TPA: sialidase family protein, partial [Thermoanaerobaculia bacterium]|nr:sialidase family protein [Thermoanaerobaculia bacterium]
ETLAASLGANIDLSGGVSTYQGELQIAVDPNNPQHLVAGANSFYKDPTAACLSPAGGAANTYGTQALYGSTDGGATWVYQCAPWNPSVTGGVTGAAFWFGSDPAMTFDSAGNAYAVYMLVSQNGAGTAAGASIVIAKSTNTGASWSNLGIIVNRIGVSTNLDDKEMVAIDTSSGQAHSHANRIYVIWDEGNSERVAYSDNGTSWTTVSVHNAGSSDIGGDIEVGKDGTVYAVWNELHGSGGDVTVFKRSTDGGATWSTSKTAFSHSLASFGSNNVPPVQADRGVNAFASIDVDKNSASAYFGTLYIATPDFPVGTSSGNNINTYVVRSTDNGDTWSSRVLVNDDGVTTNTQIFPWLAVDQSDGSVNVAWYDTRVDTTNHRKSQIYYGRSVNGGTSFEANLLVNDNGANFTNAVNYSDENATDNANQNANQYGDYMGIAASNRQVHSLWTDTRNYFPVNGTKKEDAATSTIVNCSAPAWGATPTASCGGATLSISWTAPAWGTNATGGTYTVYRHTDAGCTSAAVQVAADIPGT